MLGAGLTIEPMVLYRRRWTVYFTLPFAGLMLAVCAYSIFLMFTGDKLVMLIGGVGAFATFCIGGTVGKSGWDALFHPEAAVVIDADGLHDARGTTGPVAWNEIEKVRLDVAELRIYVHVGHQTPNRHPLASTTRRLFTGGDFTVSLSGLGFDERQLAKALAAHHRQGRARHAD